MAWSDRWQTVNWRLFAYFLIIPILIFYALTLTGCFPTLQNIFLLKLQLPSADGAAHSEIRVGYFALCGGNPSNFICLSTQGMTASSIHAKLRQFSAPLPNTTNTEPLIQFGLTLQRRIFPPLLTAAGTIFALGLIALTLLKLDIRTGQQTPLGQPLPSPQRTERYRNLTVLLFWTSTGLALASTVAVAQTASGIQYSTGEISRIGARMNGTDTDLRSLSASTPDHPIIVAGIALQVLQWLTVASLFVFSWGVSAMYGQPLNNGASYPYLGTKGAGPLLPGPGGMLRPPPPPPPPPFP